MKPLTKQILKIIGGACLIGGICTLLLCLYFIKIQDDFDEYTFSNRFIVHHCTLGDKVYLKHHRTHQRLTPNLDRIMWQQDQDTLAIFMIGNKYGYLNKHSGTIQLNAIYDEAWRFSEGVAAILHNNELCFIDETGQLIKNIGIWDINDCLSYPPIFIQGSCILKKHGCYGLWNKSGKCQLEHKYDTIIPQCGYWLIKKNNHYGVVDSLAQWILPIQFDEISIHSNGITARKKYDQQLFSFDGRQILNSHVYNNVWILSDTPLYYCYKISDKCGLMNRNMKPLTPPIYHNITLLYNQTFLAELDDGKTVIVNAKL